MTTYLKGTRDDVQREISTWAEKATSNSDSAVYDGTGIEFQTDKPTIKVVPCTGCAKPLGVNVFYAPAIAKCRECSGAADTAGVGESPIVQAGRTDPAKAANLSHALINREFEQADCPLCKEPAELKHVIHNGNYGPSRFNGKGYENTTGETALLQCNHCKTTISFSTTTQMVLRRQNEPKTTASARPPHFQTILGERGAA